MMQYPGPGMRRFSWLSALVAFIALSLVAIATRWPALPATAEFRIRFPEGVPGRLEPIITTGVTGMGDLLMLRYEARNRAVFVHDSWGSGGPASKPFTFEPGQTYTLELSMPSLSEIAGVSVRVTAPLRIVLDGQELINEDVRFFQRHTGDLHFSVNGIGGTGERTFRGQLFRSDGKPLDGGPETYFSTASRIGGYLASWHPLVGVVLISAICGVLAPRAVRFAARARKGLIETPAHTSAPHGVAALTIAFCTFVFAYVMTGGTFALIYAESFGVFYDHQALSLLHGRLDVPESSLSGEAFFHGGKCYGYFGPTPALFRLPLILLGVGFGLVSRALMVLYFIGAGIAVYQLLCLSVRLRRGEQAWPSKFATVTLLCTALLGSTLFFLASRAYIYHEAILCGAALALWSVYCSLRYLQKPTVAWGVTALIGGTLAVHARPPVGLYALVVVGVVAAFHVIRAWLPMKSGAPDAGHSPTRRRWIPLLMGVSSILGVLSFNGLSYLKFGTIEGCPLRYNVQYSPERLARIDGKQFHLTNVRFGLGTYVLTPTLAVRKQFPYFFHDGADPAKYPRAKLDLVEPMAGLPWAMPGLTLLALIGLATASRSLLPQIGAIWIAAIPSSVAMFAAIAVSHRYTGDFVPFLIAAASIGMAGIDRFGGAWGWLCRSVIVAVCITSVAITAALTLRQQGEMLWGVAPEIQERYQALKQSAERLFDQHP